MSKRKQSQSTLKMRSKSVSEASSKSYAFDFQIRNTFLKMGYVRQLTVAKMQLVIRLWLTEPREC